MCSYVGAYLRQFAVVVGKEYVEFKKTGLIYASNAYLCGHLGG